MQVYTAYSYELDNPELAVKQLIESLPLEAIKGKNAVGILTVQTDAIDSGVVAAISEAMPFDVIGMTVFASSGGREVDLSLVSMMVLVSDTLTFTTAISSDLSNSYKDEVNNLYSDIMEKAKEKPSLCLVFASFLRHYPGQELVSYLSDISEGVPIFGGLASDFTYFSDGASIFCNGKILTRGMALLCVSGPVKASFLYASLLPDELQSKEYVITSSQENVVSMVNDIPVANYLESLGFSMEELAKTGTDVPFLIDCHDGTGLLARELAGVTAENAVFFGGNMLQGSSIYISRQTSGSVMSTTNEMLQAIKSKEDKLCGVLAMNCSERSVILASDPLQETKNALELIGPELPWLQCYVRGEICPALLQDGKLENRFHNFTLVACLFEKIDA